VSDREFILWRAFDAISPIGGERADKHAALVAALIANANRGPKQAPYSLNDFDLFRDPPPPKTREQEEAEFREAFMQAGLVVVKG